MKFLVKVKVKKDQEKLQEFAAKVESGELDSSALITETFCYKDDPQVGITVWECETEDEFNQKFNPWMVYCDEVEVKEVVAPDEAMKLMFVDSF